MTVALTSYMKSSQLVSGKMPKNVSDALNSVYTACAKSIRSGKAATTEEAAAQLLASQARAKLVEEARLLTDAQWDEFALCLAGVDRRFGAGSHAPGPGTPHKSAAGKARSKEGGARGKDGEERYDLTATGTLCEVEWDRDWWLATVLEHKKDKVQVCPEQSLSRARLVLMVPRAAAASV
eukprot:2963520-Rhodomonas_salina.2